jgi:hypothetical protein
MSTMSWSPPQGFRREAPRNAVRAPSALSSGGEIGGTLNLLETRLSIHSNAIEEAAFRCDAPGCLFRGLPEEMVVHCICAT